MLAITDSAASAIDGIIASRRLPTEAGLRITREAAGSADGERARATLRLRLVGAPRSGDYLLTDTRVFLAPEAAAVLADQLLDVELNDGGVRFGLRERS